MSIAATWRTASGLNPELRLIESTADDLPPVWQITCQGEEGAEVDLYARPPRGEGFAPLGALTLAGGSATVSIPPMAEVLRAQCDSAIDLIVVGDLPRALAAVGARRPLHPVFRGRAIPGVMLRADAWPDIPARLVIGAQRPATIQVHVELVDDREVDLETAEVLDWPTLRVALSAEFRGAVAPVPLGDLSLAEFPIRFHGGLDALRVVTTGQPLGSALRIVLCGEPTHASPV